MSVTTKPEVSPARPGSRSRMVAAAIAEARHIELVETPRPEPGPCDLRVRLEGCGVCASNVPSWEGRPWFEYPMAPGAPGHEGWGRVEAIGSKVTGFGIGDRVAFLSSHSYAQCDVTPAASALKLPGQLDAMPFPGESLGCAMNIFARSRIEPGADVAIVGFGFLGALLAQLAVGVGARVVVLSRREESIPLARALGVEDAILIEEGNARPSIERVRELTQGKFCPVVVEVGGKQESLDLATELTGERGRLVIAGYHQDGPRQVNMQLWNWRGLDVINAHEREPRVYMEGMRKAVDAVVEGRISPGKLFSHQFPLERLGEALEMAAKRPPGFIKALVLMEPVGAAVSKERSAGSTGSSKPEPVGSAEQRA